MSLPVVFTAALESYFVPVILSTTIAPSATSTLLAPEILVIFVVVNSSSFLIPLRSILPVYLLALITRLPVPSRFVFRPFTASAANVAAPVSSIVSKLEISLTAVISNAPTLSLSLPAPPIREILS